MSEVTTLKQLMLDAARYRGLKKEIVYGTFFDEAEQCYVEIDPDDLDEYIDEVLDREP